MRSIILLSLTAGITDPVLREEFGKRKILNKGWNIILFILDKDRGKSDQISETKTKDISSLAVNIS